jgi:hypothetical protein
MVGWMTRQRKDGAAEAENFRSLLLVLQIDGPTLLATGLRQGYDLFSRRVIGATSFGRSARTVIGMASASLRQSYPAFGRGDRSRPMLAERLPLVQCLAGFAN